MEIVLSIIVIIILLVQKSEYSKNNAALKREINSLNDKINRLYGLLKSEKEPNPLDKEPLKVTPEKTIEPPLKVPVKEPTSVHEKQDDVYQPKYSKVVHLTDRDISIIKKIVSTADPEALKKLRQKMIEVLKVDVVKEHTDLEFINSILKDYEHYKQHKPVTESTAAEPITKPEIPGKPEKMVASAKTVMTPDYSQRVEEEPTLSYWEQFKKRNPDLEKFIGENLINKIGILILVLGVSYFVKFAIDKNWINEPARVGIGILTGTLVLFIAHKLRKKYAPFSSVLVAGAIAIFYFTIFIAFHEYKLFGQEVAFAIMVLITAFSSFISLSYNRMELAILSLIGGFLAPFLVSTGAGNYIVLFTYIAILDAGILALAYFKKWQLLQILSFVFTLLLFCSWVISDIQDETPHYLGALIFGFVFYLIFISISIFNKISSKGQLSNIQLTMLTANNFVFYGVGMLILTSFKPDLRGSFTAFLAVLNMGYAFFAYKKFGLGKNGLYLLIGLSLTFITLAIPVQFSGNNITIFWAVEAVFLMWLAQKTQIKNYRFAAVIVQFLMLISLLLDWDVYFEADTDFEIILNPVFIAGVFGTISFMAINYLLKDEKKELELFSITFNPIFYRRLTSVLAVITGYFLGFFEVIYQSNQSFQFEGALAIVLQYHLLFTTVLCYLLYKNRTANHDIILNVIAALNIVCFGLLFSKIPIWEFTENALADQTSQIAYYLHWPCLILSVVQWYFIYQTNKAQKVSSILNHQLALWSAVFVLVFAASVEVIIQGLYIMEIPFDQVLSYERYELIVTAKNKIIKTGFPVLWGVLAFLLLIWGIRKQVKQLRIIALSLLGITIIKLFVYDISNVSETGKIIAFILLGILILIISFVYQKIKLLVIDEDKPKKEDRMN
ncbi:DUF2339 domain-containing protein [Gaetbulibacter sp. M240]|uniref:DUF2339 domain-containing protein n=1 Tax=Gaetbulibacter sp. M240 TaxID=3126511 RepID=UPI00374E6DFB